MRTVRQLLEAKAPEIYAIGPDSAVIDAIRLMADKHASVVELQPRRHVQLVGKRLAHVGQAVAVGVLEDENLVVHLVAGIPVRIRRHNGDPQPAPRIEGHLHGIG